MRAVSFLAAVALCLPVAAVAQTNESILPAGTLLQCTVDEPEFSSKTAQAGDPVLCHVGSLGMFGQPMFPRGAYLSGRLEGFRDPGRFVGKGWMTLEFDHLSLPDAVLPLPAKLVGVRGYRVDREGKIQGRGHAKRDAVEWLMPPLWPWKVLSLPARGPRPTLKGETQITLRLMEDMAVPLVAVTPQPPASRPAEWKPWRPPAPPLATNSEFKVERGPAPRVLIALKEGTIYGVKDYWIEGGRLSYTFENGAEGSFDFADVDWRKTIQLNAEGGIAISLRTRSQ